MKKILISLLTLILVISISISVNAATTGTVSISLSNETIKAGDEFSIIVTATDSNNLNTVEYSGLTVTDEEGDVSTAITVKSVEAIGDNWAKMNAEGKTNFVYSGEAIQSQQVFKVTFTVGDSVEAGIYKINVEGIKVSSTNLDDITTDIGTKSVSVKAIVDDTTVGNQGGTNTDDENIPEEKPENTVQTPSNTTDSSNESTGSDSGNKATTTNKKENTVKNTNKNTTSKLPQTGIEDASVIAVIALAAMGISSYISYRKYKNI